MAEAPRIGDPNDINAGIGQAAYESAKKEIPTAYGRAQAIEPGTPSADMITHVPSQEELVAQKNETFDAELNRMQNGLKNLSEYTVPHADVVHLEHVKKNLEEYLHSLAKIIEAKKAGQY